MMISSVEISRKRFIALWADDFFNSPKGSVAILTRETEPDC